jgi:hypothetical protein
VAEKSPVAATENAAIPLDAAVKIAFLSAFSYR